MPFQISGMAFLPLVSTNEEKFLIEDKQFISLIFMACDFCIKDIFIYYLLKTVWLLPTTFRYFIPKTDFYIWCRHPIFMCVGIRFPLLNINHLLSQNDLQ